MVVSNQMKSVAGCDWITDRLQEKSQALCQIVPKVPQPETVDSYFSIYLCKASQRGDSHLKKKKKIA